MKDTLLRTLCVFQQRSLRRADHPSREVLPSVVCLSVDPETSKIKGTGPLGAVIPARNLNEDDSGHINNGCCVPVRCEGKRESGWCRAMKGEGLFGFC